MERTSRQTDEYQLLIDKAKWCADGVKPRNAIRQTTKLREEIANPSTPIDDKERNEIFSILSSYK